jgi:hypothetical protein
MGRGNAASARVQAARRRVVARLHLRGMSQREIVEELPKQDPPIANPETGEAYSLGQINADVQFLTREWIENAAKDFAEHKARHLARVEEAYRAAFDRMELNVVMRSLEHEAKVLGIVGVNDTAESIARGAQAYLAEVHTIKRLAEHDLSE